MAEDALSDESLLAGLAIGDRDACTAFVRRHQRRVYGLALHLVGRPDVAEDIAQEAFARAWKHAAAFDARRGSVITWLLTITRNLAIDSLRVRRPEPMAHEDLALLAGLGPAVDERLPVDEVERLRGALAQLPVEQRRALVLAAWYGQTAKEIGEAEDVPIGTVKTRIRAAMLKLRDALAVQP